MEAEMEPKVIETRSRSRPGGDAENDTEKVADMDPKGYQKGPPKAPRNRLKCDPGPLRGPRGAQAAAEVPPWSQKSPKSTENVVEIDDKIDAKRTFVLSEAHIAELKMRQSI